MTGETAYTSYNWGLNEHLSELNVIARRISFALIVMCLFWSLSIDYLITQWLDLLPLETGPNNENMSIYGPFDWIQLRWSAVILLAFLSLMPLISIQAYSFARSGLYPVERNWFISVLLLTTTIIPIIIFLVWSHVIPILFELSEASGRPDGVLVRYDAASIFSIGMALSWVLVIWSITTISLSLTRMFGMVKNGKPRFRKRLLAISSGAIILTLPIEFDGLKILIAILSLLSANLVSNSFPGRIATNGAVDI